ncbi:hypothetical protein ASF41_19205 [Methylobacterium sp. Leaf111]|uniref:hypothetical protein n=1 Tax=Methylobacterium sp. Leaf111 TaxID=1736257 RepID=UPI0006F642BF|nr:hypothetical protein [Methylobacterium sp. Leaf111]KQP72974.1 hypothetical protein ASF41_19205 [Methylobacterium sp. Leaf111]
MSKGYPSMTALLGLLAVAGYQNRDKLAELLKGHEPTAPQRTVPPIPNTASTGTATGSGGLGNLAGLLGGVGTAGHLTQQTGLSRGALLSRLSRELPSAIDRYAADGRRPA